MAPEQFSKEAYNPFKAEIYTLGVFLFHLIYKAFPHATNASQDSSAANPFNVIDFEASPRNIHKIKASQALIELLQAMLTYDPTQRITLEGIRRSVWF